MLIVIKWMPDLIFKKKWFKKTWNQYNCIKLIYIWNQIFYLVCNLSKLNRHWPLGCRQTEISCIGIFDTNLRHWTHDTQIHRTTECPAKLSMFYFAQKIIYKSIDFIFYACWLFMNEFVNMFLKSMIEIVHRYCNDSINRGYTLCWLVLIFTFHVLGIKSGQAFQGIDPLPLAVRLD